MRRNRRKPLQIQLNDQELAQLRALAEHDGVSLGQAARTAIRERVRQILPVRDVA